jgi:hypothetical protein
MVGVPAHIPTAQIANTNKEHHGYINWLGFNSMAPLIRGNVF